MKTRIAAAAFFASLVSMSLVPMGAPAWAAEPANFVSEIQDLKSQSTAVIIGSIERREIDVAQTSARVRVIKSFSGPLKEGQQITFKTHSGRVQVGKNEPELTGVDRAVFYMMVDSDGNYHSVNDYYGFKPIIHDNVYINPQNPLETVKLKKYQESLTAVLNPNPKAKAG